MNPQKSAEELVRIGVGVAFIPLRVTRDIGSYALERVGDYFDGRPDIVKSRLAEMPLNEAKIASQQIEIAENRLDFPEHPVTLDEVAAHQQGRRVQKAMTRNAFTRLGRSVLYAEVNPIVPDPVVDEVVAIATEQRLDPERLDEAEFEEIDRRRISRVLMARQGNRPPFGVRQLVRAFFRP